MKASEKRIGQTNSIENQTAEAIVPPGDSLSKKGAINHELVDADVQDQEIKSTTGATDLDQEITDVTNSLNSSSENGGFLKNKKTKRMQFWVDYFTKNQRERFQRFINNGEEYRNIIQKIFTKHDLPLDLYYVGLIESGYYLGARSHAAATGPWQFIKGTATRYGLKVNHEIDERHDIFKATEAAAMYFKDLHNVFLSWELALSAYNAGEYGVMRRIMKHGTRDFYQLSQNKQLPSETINYVPKVLAAKHIIENAKKYGFTIPRRKVAFFDKTKLTVVSKNSSLKTIAKSLKIDYQILKKLNPELKRDSTPRYFAGNYRLRIPSDKAALDYLVPVEKNETLAQVETPRPSRVNSKINTHKVKRGETLLSISRRYGLTPKTLASYNSFSSWKRKLKVGEVLSLQTRRSSINHPQSPIVYKVQRGDNLSKIAEIFDLEISKLKRANRLKRGEIQVGQKIILPETKRLVYTVKRGDYLARLSDKFNLSTQAIVKLNNLNKGKIYPGQKLIVNKD
jgi:membrane-bound lytic murein transglycosylase D